MVKPIVPMEPVSTERIPEGDDWLAQIKWDGVRVLTYFDGQKVRLFNRKKNERTYHYPELTDIKSYCETSSVILDGEVIALGSDGKPDFHTVMKRDGIRKMDRVDQVRRQVPITYMIFDILYLNGAWVNDCPLEERILLLSEIITPSKTTQLVDSVEDAENLYSVMEKHGMEGIVIKRKGSPHLLGQKKDMWLKMKNYLDVVGVVGGFTLRQGLINALLLGMYDEEGDLYYVGHTGTGKFPKSKWRELTKELIPQVVKEKPFVNRTGREKEAYWVRPEMTVKVQFLKWTADGSLWQPSIQAFVDVPPEQCILE